VLFFAAAILYSSVHVLGVAGSTGAPVTTDHHAPVVAVSASAQLAGHGTSAAAVEVVPTLSAPVEGVPAKTASTLAACGADASGAATSVSTAGRFVSSECLQQLATVPASRLAVFGRSLDADTGDDLAFASALERRGSAAQTGSWWRSIDAVRRTELIGELPAVVGNLEGVPYASRNLANRSTLESTIRRLERREALADAGLTAHSSSAARLTMLQKVQQSLAGTRAEGTAGRSLVSLDTVFPGRAAIAVGDLDTADDVSVVVPGMLYTVSTQMVAFTSAAAALQSEQSFWSSTLATASTERVASSAVVAWMGYRTPGVTTVLGLGLAREGASHLESAVQGLDAVRASDPARVTIVAHSYGSTTSTIALSSGKIHVDDFVALGSPGSVVPTASKLDVTGGNVFAAAAPLDPVAGSAVFGADPGSTGFGAKLLNLGAMIDPYTEQKVGAVMGHNQYFTTGSHAMRSLALIGIGRGDLADGRSPNPDGPTTLNQPTFALVRPQDVNRDAMDA
jgi:hypothetical protein